MADTLISDFLGAVDEGAVTFFTQVSSQFASALGPTAKSLLTIGIILWALAMYFGYVREPIMDGLMRALRATAIIAIALGPGIYNSWIATNVYALPDQLTQLVTGKSNASVNMFLDDTLEEGKKVALEIKDSSSGMSLSDGFGIYLTALVAYVVVLVVCGFAGAIILLLKLALAILLGFGPLFIIFLLISPTKHILNGWAQQMLNFVLLYPFAAAVVILLFTVWKVLLSAMAVKEIDPWNAFGSVLLTGFACFYVLLQVPLFVRGIVSSWHLDPIPMVRGFVAGAIGTGAVARAGAIRSGAVVRAGAERGYRAGRAAAAGASAAARWARSRASR